ncbi:MAG: hypothetical protein GVY27_07505, partial [Deinococcus-Thermus bacterium]|nr:hypothetical protein [Deinococcota bacterium]
MRPALARPGRGFRVLLVLAALLAVLAGAGSVAGQEALPSDRDWLRDAASRGRLFDRIAERLESVYHAPGRIAWPEWRDEHRDRVAAAGGRAALDAALRRAFTGLGDGHSRWVGREAASAPLPSAPDGPPVRLGVRAQPLNGQGLLLVRVHPGGAADRAGLARGDVIVRAGGDPLTEPG